MQQRFRVLLFACLTTALSAACSSDTTTGTGRPTGTDWRGTFSRHDTVTFGYNCGSTTCGGTYAFVSPSLEVSWAGGGTFVATGRTISSTISGSSVSNVRQYDEVILIQNRGDSVYLDTQYGAVPNTSVTANGIVAVSTDPTTVPCSQSFVTTGDVAGKTCRVVTRWVRLD